MNIKWIKVKKKPVKVKAFQFTDKIREKIPLGFSFLEKIQFHKDSNGTVTIKTLEGYYVVSKGDWIICGIKGEFYPIKPDIFFKTYKKVEHNEKNIRKNNTKRTVMHKTMP